MKFRSVVSCLLSGLAPSALFRAPCILEYINLAWCPRSAPDSNKLKVQRRATKLVPTIRHFLHQERLRHLNLYSLSYRCTQGDVMHVFRIIRGQDRIKPHHFMPAPLTSTMGHPMKVFNPRRRVLLRSSFISERVSEVWNSLQPSLVESTFVTIVNNNNLDKS